MIYEDWLVYREESKACGFEYLSWDEYSADMDLGD
jgi:hypothetical protein